MPLSKDVRVGIIGFGGIARAHADAIKEIEGAHLVAATDIRQEQLDLAKENYDVDVYSDYHELLARDDIDVVDICTPSGLHGQIAIDAAEAGKHIITEKPMDVDLAVCDRMIETAKRCGVKLSVIFQNRFKADVQRLKRLIEEGKFGTIFLADAYIKWYRTQEYYEQSTRWRGTLTLDGGGVIVNQSVHYIDLLQWLMGPVSSIYAQTATVAHDIEGEDVGLAILNFANGALGVIEGSTACYPGFDARIEFHGTNGSAVLVSGNLERIDLLEGEEVVTAEAKEYPGVSADPLAMGTAGHRSQLERFLQAVVEDTEPDITGEEGRKSVEIVRGIYESARLGQPVTLPLK